MFVIIGYILVLFSVFGGFALAGGHLASLFQPIELLMIGGSGVGAFVCANGPKSLKAIMKALPLIFKANPYNKLFCTDLLAMMFLLTTKIRKDGMLSIEADIEEPEQSEIFKNYPRILHDHHLMEFLVDYLRLIVSGNTDFFQLENLMDNEIETHHMENDMPPHAITKLADSMPAFGIVAAVMGVVHTMESIGLPPSELGALVGAALVGTFLGILLGYGFIGPLAALLESRVQDSTRMYQCIKVILLATISNYVPTIAVEFGRKSLFSIDRPSSQELEVLIKEIKGK